MKIKVKLLNDKCILEPTKKGDWIDLKSSRYMHIAGPYADTLKKNGDDKVRSVHFNYDFIPLGIIMKLPKGYEAIVNPRSSTFLKFGVIFWNSQGVIDNTYCGNDDEWRLPAIAINECTVKEGDRVCQFRIQLNQYATMWQKIKWLFSSKIEFEYVEDLNEDSRGGFGSTGYD